MISVSKWREIKFILFLSIFFNRCVRPEDNAINPPGKDLSSVAPAKTGPQLYIIEIREMKFIPAEITLHKGDTVVWKNNDIVEHCVTGENTKAWTSSKIKAGGSWEMVADTSADYFCAIHLVMKGKIIVE